MTTDNDAETLPQPSLARTEPRPDIVAGGEVMALLPRNIDEVFRYAKMLLLAGAVPDSLTKEGGRQLSNEEVVSRVVATIAAGSEIGMPPMAAMANIALINKRRLIWGQGVVAVLQASGQLEDMKVERLGQQPGAESQTVQFADGFGIRVTLKRKGKPTPFIGEMTVGQAKRAHLWMNTNKRPWIEHPEQMLFWRALSKAAGAGFGDCLAGLQIREVYDEPPAPPPITDTSFLDTPSPKPAELPAPEERPLPAAEPVAPAAKEAAAISTGDSPGPSSTGEASAAPRRRRTREQIAMDMFKPSPLREEVVPDPAERPADNAEPPAETGGEREPGAEG